MTMAPLPFQKIEQCRKCCSDDIETRYRASGGIHGELKTLLNSEHLEVTCNDCGYRAAMYCKDKKLPKRTRDGGVIEDHVQSGTPGLTDWRAGLDPDLRAKHGLVIETTAASRSTE